MQDVQITLPLGTVLQGRYEVTNLLGRGGFGAVYLVKDQRVRGNLFALKELVDPDQKERARFTFEGEVLKRLDHSSLPRVYRVFEEASNNRAYMLMDYIEGPNLEILRQQQAEKRFPLAQVISIMAPIVAAVNYLHHLSPPIIHRDIKPANIIVPTDGEEAVLVDFGIAKEYDQDSTTTAVRRCSPGYGAPEQYARGTNPGTDVYGLGATFYALLTGTIPADALYRMTHLGSKGVDPLEPLEQLVPGIPAHVSEAVQHALAVNSKDRYASVDEFWQVLSAQPAQHMLEAEGVAHQQRASDPGLLPVEDIATIVVPVRDKPARTNRRTAIALLFLSLALFALIAGLVFGNNLLSTRHLSGRITPVPSASTSSAHSAGTAGTTATSSAHSTATAGTTATSRPQTTATSAATSYPGLAAAYKGSIINQSVNPSVTTSMTLTNIRQSGAKVSGYFTVGPELIGNGNFTGSVTQNKKIQFLVASYNNNLPLFFSGTIAANGSMSGQYCSYQNAQCVTSGGQGTWSVSPGMPGAGSSLRPTSPSDRPYI